MEEYPLTLSQTNLLLRLLSVCGVATKGLWGGEMRDILFCFLLTLLFVTAFTWGGLRERDRNEIELKALQAQVDKKYCEGEVTYPELLEESRR